MIEVSQYQLDSDQSERNKAKATARLIYYASREAEELGLGDCRQLLHFVAGLIRVRYGLQDQDLMGQPARPVCLEND